MRAEQAAAFTNFLLILLLALGLAMVSELSRTDAVVYAHPYQYTLRIIATALLMAVPLAAVASWRTWVHAQHFLRRHTTGWQGVLEAAALGFALTLPAVLPGVVVRQFDPGPWGQPQALFLGVAYTGAYGLLGLFAGCVLGLILRCSAIVVLRVHRRFAP